MTHFEDVERMREERPWDGIQSEKRVATLLTAYDKTRERRLDFAAGFLSLVILGAALYKITVYLAVR